MRFSEKAGNDLVEIKKIISSGVLGTAFNYLLTQENKEYRNKLIADIEKAIKRADLYGDEELYFLYYKGSKELWVSAIQGILINTLNEIKQGTVQRHTNQTIIEEKNKTITDLKQKITQVSDDKQKLELHIRELKSSKLEDNDSDYEQDFTTGTAVDLSSSLLVDFAHIISLAKHHEYEKTAELLVSLSQRSFSKEINSKELELVPAIAQLESCKLDICSLVANNILSELKKLMPQHSSAFTLFFHDDNASFYNALQKILEKETIYLIEEKKIKDKNDLILFTKCIYTLILDYSRDAKWNQDSESYAEVIFQRGLANFNENLQERILLSYGFTQINENDIDEIKEIRQALIKELEKVEAILADFSVSKTSQIKHYLNNRGSEIVNAVINAPFEQALKILEIYISPVTASAKELGKARAEMEYFKRQVGNVDGASSEKQKGIYEDLHKKLKNIIRILGKVIAMLESEEANPTSAKLH